MKRINSVFAKLNITIFTILLVAGSMPFFAQKNENQKLSRNKNGLENRNEFQTTGIDETFSPRFQSFAELNVADIQSEGKIIIGGKFSFLNESPNQRSDRLERLNVDGSLDKSFVFSKPSEWDGAQKISLIKVQPDDKILIAKDDKIIRLNKNGELDSSFHSVKFSNNYFPYLYLNDIQIYPDGKILVVGVFNNVNNTTSCNIVRLNRDGTIDNSFLFANYVQSIEFLKSAITSENKIFIGVINSNWYQIGLFPKLNEDGTIDNSFIWSKTQYEFKNVYHEESFLKNIIIEKNGNMIVSGAISNRSQYWKNEIRGVYRLDPNGRVINIFEDTGYSVYLPNVFLQNDGKVIVYNISYNYENGNNLIRYNSDGTRDANFHFRISYNRLPSTDLIIQKDGKILVYGDLLMVNGISKYGIVRLNQEN